MSGVEASADRARAGAEQSPAVPWPAVSVVLVGAFMATLDAFIVIVAGPSIQSGLGASAGELQWILVGYQLTYAVFLITGGRLGDLYGRRRMFITGMAVFTAASAACAAAPTAAVLVVARLVQGLGAAVMLPQVFASVTVLVPARSRHRVFGVLGVVLGLATIGGQLIGGLLIGADLFGSTWRPVFWINVPIGAATIWTAARWLPASRATGGRRLDIPGVLVLSVALFLLVFPLIQGRQEGWPSWTWVCLAAGALGFGAFAVIEKRTGDLGGDPLVRVSLFRTRTFGVGILLILALYTVVTSYYLVLSISLQDGLGLSALGAGLTYTPAAVTFFTFSMIAGRLVPRYGRRVLEAGALALVAGYAATAIVLLGGAPFTPGVIVPTLMLQSVGGGLLITPAMNTVLARIAPADAGTASGVLSTSQQIGGALGVAVIGAVFFTVLGHPTGDPAEAAGHALAVASLATMTAAIAAAVLVRLLPAGRPG
ncbi:MFS transporter [Streptomyces sp. enrichment culture]|uniref:MFS transporter n=1 Tax=Streptomyces sp. enrichment culture TaxID=1795815 RepID=UPI003F54CBCE